MALKWHYSLLHCFPKYFSKTFVLHSCMCETPRCTWVLSPAAFPLPHAHTAFLWNLLYFCATKCRGYAFLPVAMPTVWIWSVGKCVTDFFSHRGVEHIHLILCLRGLVSDAFIVVSHVQAKANTLKQLLQCVCVFTLFYSFFRLLYGSKGSELELLTTSAQWQTDRELMISRFLFFF